MPRFSTFVNKQVGPISTKDVEELDHLKPFKTNFVLKISPN